MVKQQGEQDSRVGLTAGGGGPQCWEDKVSGSFGGVASRFWHYKQTGGSPAVVWWLAGWCSECFCPGASWLLNWVPPVGSGWVLRDGVVLVDGVCFPQVGYWCCPVDSHMSNILQCEGQKSDLKPSEESVSKGVKVWSVLVLIHNHLISKSIVCESISMRIYTWIDLGSNDICVALCHVCRLDQT